MIAGDDREQLTLAARYGARAPLALSRLTCNREQERISYSYTNPYDTCVYNENITPHELIARLMTHIPGPWEQNNRYFGWHSNRTQGVRMKYTPVGSDLHSEGEEKEAPAPLHWRRQWAELLHLVFEIRLIGPRCGSEMKILSFITEPEPIRKILAHLKENGIDARAGPFAYTAACNASRSLPLPVLYSYHWRDQYVLVKVCRRLPPPILTLSEENKRNSGGEMKCPA